MSILLDTTNMSFSKLFSQNAWTNPGIDTRNVAVHDFILLVEDVPDSPPYFLVAPPVTRLPETAKKVNMYLVRFKSVIYLIDINDSFNLLNPNFSELFHRAMKC